jgi:hypothetical protein
MTGHVPAVMLRDYAAGAVDAPHAFSVEAHLIECDACRDDLRAHVDAPRLDRLWLEVEDTLDQPVPGPVELVLRRLGISPHIARLLAATPSLRLAWLAAVAVALAFAVAAAHQGERGLLLFLVLAAVLPPVGVAASFGPALNPTYEVGLAAPFSTLRLILLRTVAVLVTTVLIAAVAALALPDVGWTAAAWLLPSLALTAASLALATYVAPHVAVGIVALVWLAGAVVAATGGGDRLGAFHAGGQLLLVAIGAVAAAVAITRRERLDVGRGL